MYVKLHSLFNISCYTVHNLLSREQNILLFHHLKDLFYHVSPHVIVDFITDIGFLQIFMIPYIPIFNLIALIVTSQFFSFIFVFYYRYFPFYLDYIFVIHFIVAK